MNAYRIRPLKYPWPPVFYVVAVAVALGISKFVPLHIVEQKRLWLQACGATLFLIGVGIALWAFLTLLSHHTSVLSTSACNRLVTCGPFRVTRNPIYLGYTLVTLSLGLITANGWIIAAAIISAAVTHLYVIRREEKHLLARFGFEFERYCRRTRAWI
ncbi:isoprenylcysteine carboxylmethyltransferase family protein [Rhizobium sp. KVB221]|uniref:Isoprenylcysteine carboxylmethyltransferase family protein n=1 Tax=Rhizobium setariae TaxID=2801340 RepID=A0A937CPM4_9HYPH|nr:isoprenylcysteine carboxylmethyltransferase family protein [Rhizobium setariae]MBL0375081.1 isoprenylcysteine carboxylmethyltransferase family protein [Rhizobium setariae]